MGKLKNQIRLTWNSNLAYAIGLITSDGSLNSDQRHIWFSSAEKEMLLNFKKALEINNKIGRYARGGEKIKKYFYISFSSKTFYNFLNTLGITQAKSKTIKKVSIPYIYFHDFLRGLFDGDGTFYTFQDKRWPNSHGYQISFASASPIFIQWLKNELTKFYSVKGFICQGKGVLTIRYVKRDTITLFFVMYKNNMKGKILFLRRKYDKIMKVFSKDKLFQKTINAGLAHR